MAGYIIGLGDRHLANILIDRRSAELVHIDLGIAFEQGRLLNTPELVPFRLTRDIVDGFGVTGPYLCGAACACAWLYEGPGPQCQMPTTGHCGVQWATNGPAFALDLTDPHVLPDDRHELAMSRRVLS